MVTNKALKYAAGLIAVYLFVKFKGGDLLKSATDGGVNTIKAFQGR